MKEPQWVELSKQKPPDAAEWEHKRYLCYPGYEVLDYWDGTFWRWHAEDNSNEECRVTHWKELTPPTDLNKPTSKED